jgi:predicted Zn-dependent protease
MRRESYAVEAMVDMFTLLEQKAEVEGASALPTWASTHPSPADRRERTLAAIAESPSAPDAVFGRERYLERIDGMIFSNPREGYFEGSLFLHPELEFQIEFPVGWRTQNTRSSVFGASPNQEAVIQLSLAEGRSPERALADFLAGEGIRGGDMSRTTINGLAAAAAEFGASTQQGTLRGLAVFLSHGGRLYRLLGYASAGQFPSFESTIERSFGTFDRLTDPRILAMQPARVKVVTVDREMPIGEVGRRHVASVDAATLALLNGLAPGESVPAGASVKVVIGGELPRR